VQYGAGSVLAPPYRGTMRILWWIPLTVLAVGAGVLVRVRRRSRSHVMPTTDTVSGDWLAHARGRDEQEW
jgi:cytochrome c-type biogenesis protein CcmH/NrfF